MSEATEEQLRKFASETLGIDIKESAKIETVRARIKACWNQPDIPVLDGDSVAPGLIPAAPAQPVTPEQQPPSEDMVRLTIGVTEDAGGADDVDLAVNGKVMRVPRGRSVEIPNRFFEALFRSVTFMYDPIKDGGINPEPRKVPLYPYQVLGASAFVDDLIRRDEAIQNQTLAA